MLLNAAKLYYQILKHKAKNKAKFCGRAECTCAFSLENTMDSRCLIVRIKSYSHDALPCVYGVW